MTDSMDRSSTNSPLGNIVADALRAAGKLESGTFITTCVAVVQTATIKEDGRLRYDIHRVYPLDQIDPSLERGVLSDALDDSIAQRREAR